MAFNLDAVLNIAIPIGIFIFIFFLFYSSIPIFKRMVDAIGGWLKEQITGVKEQSSNPSDYVRTISYG